MSALASASECKRSDWPTAGTVTRKCGVLYGFHYAQIFFLVGKNIFENNCTIISYMINHIIFEKYNAIIEKRKHNTNRYLRRILI